MPAAQLDQMALFKFAVVVKRFTGLLNRRKLVEHASLEFKKLSVMRLVGERLAYAAEFLLLSFQT